MPAVQVRGRTAGEGLGRTARVLVSEESHRGIVPRKHSNQDGTGSAESAEGRLRLKENPGPLLSANAQSPDQPRYDTGVIANGVYTYECMGFSVPIPTGWNFSKESGDAGTTRIGTHMPDGSIDLLMMDRYTDPASLNRIVIIARDATRFSGRRLSFRPGCGAEAQPHHLSLQRTKRSWDQGPRSACRFCGAGSGKGDP